MSATQVGSITMAAAAMVSLENPISSVWLPLAVSDKVTFKKILPSVDVFG